MGDERKASAWRRELLFSQRVAFDDALRPRLKNEVGKAIAYPDAIYHIDIDDLCRAMVASKSRTSS